MSVMRAMVVAAGINPIDAAFRSDLDMVAHTALETGHTRGKIALMISPG